MDDQLTAGDIAHLDREWAEGRDWYLCSIWTPELKQRFCDLFVMDADEFRRVATEDEIDAFQRLARLGFMEIVKRVIESRECSG